MWTTFTKRPPCRKTRCASSWSSVSTASINFLPSIAVRSNDSSTDRRDWASSRVKVRSAIEDESILVHFVKGRRPLVVGPWISQRPPPGATGFFADDQRSTITKSPTSGLAPLAPSASPHLRLYFVHDVAFFQVLP